MSNRLTKAELEAVIAVAGDALAVETLSTDDDPDAAVEAFESGMEKLRRQAGRSQRAGLSMAPSVGAWQRPLNNAAIYAAKCILGGN